MNVKIYTAKENTVQQGTEVTISPYPHIGIGEEGRARQYVRFPLVDDVVSSLPCPYRGAKRVKQVCDLCGEKAELAQVRPDLYLPPDRGEFNGKEVDYPVYIYRIAVIKTRKKGTLLGVPEKEGDNRAFVKLDIQGGFRGSCRLTGPNGEPLEDAVTVLAKGHGAEGGAGRAGGPHEKALVSMRPGDVVRANRDGRLYGNPSQIYVTWDGETLKMGEEDEIFHPILDVEEGGVEI